MDDESLSNSLEENEKVTLDLTKALRDALRRKFAREQLPSETESDQELDRDIFTSEESSIERDVEDVMARPEEHVELRVGQRRFRLIPVGTISAQPKKILRGPNGALYYIKSWDQNGVTLPRHRWSKVYLKKYQRKQCVHGKSARTWGLAGNQEDEEEERLCHTRGEPQV